MEQIKLLGVWGSPFSKRVEIALKMKGVEYEFVEEDLQNKSEELLKYNPVHKKILVLVHSGRPITESLLIMEYIDETWNGTNLLPSNPYKRAQARFWASFLDDKVWSAMRNARLSEGEESKKATEELYELLETLENEIKGKKFFAGNRVEYVDIMGLFVAYWFQIVREAISKEQLLTRENFPGLCGWADELLYYDIMKHNLPDKKQLVAFFRAQF